MNIYPKDSTMDCFNHNCPFRSNTTSSSNRCECIACPNRCDACTAYASNHTLADDELAILRAKMSHDTNHGIRNGC